MKKIIVLCCFMFLALRGTDPKRVQEEAIRELVGPELSQLHAKLVQKENPTKEEVGNYLNLLMGRPSLSSIARIGELFSLHDWRLAEIPLKKTDDQKKSVRFLLPDNQKKNEGKKDA